MEEIPDDERINVGPKLPKGATALLMTEKEYLDTLPKGEKPAPATKTQQKTPQKTSKTPEFQHKPPKYEYECQPTSSKVKVEDLVTHDQDQETPSTSTSTRSFWDRPIPKPQFDWSYDPRMPPEWNNVVASMQAHEGNRYIPRGEIYREPLDDEISEPEEFTAKYRSSTESSKQPSARLNPWWTDANRDFEEL